MYKKTQPIPIIAKLTCKVLIHATEFNTQLFISHKKLTYGNHPNILQIHCAIKQQLTTMNHINFCYRIMSPNASDLIKGALGVSRVYKN